MANENIIENLASKLGGGASVKNVFGEPVVAGEKTIIPVAQVAYGFGGGFGHGINKKTGFGTNDEDDDKPKGEGAGGGGGVMARPKGVFEITPEQTRFIPANNTKQILIGIAVGFLIRSFMRSKKKDKQK